MTLLMRTVAITVHNNQWLEVFTQARDDGFELWMIGVIKGRRIVLDHHLTHDDLERQLCYAQPGDLVWRDAARSEIPTEMHPSAVEMEGSIKRGTFVDQPSVASHFGFGAIGLVPIDRKALNAAKRAILGRWTDGVVTLGIEPNNKLRWSCADRHDPLNIGEKVHGHAPDWWNFAMWRLHLMNDQHKCGTHVGILRVDEQELHVEGGALHRLARVFQRAEAAY